MALLIQLCSLELGRRFFLNHQFGILEVQVEMSYLLHLMITFSFLLCPGSQEK